MRKLVDGFGSTFVPVMGIAANTYRVPMHHLNPTESEPEYAVSTGYNQIRYYNDTTLPDPIKSTMTMVNVFPETHHGYVMGPTTAYIPPTPEQIEIGWKFGPNLYMLVLKSEDFASLEIPHG